MRTHVTDQRVGSRFGRAENTKVVDAVQRKQSRVGRLVDGAADFSEGRISDTVGEGGDDTGLVDGSTGRVLRHDGGGGEECGGEESDGHVDGLTARDGEREARDELREKRCVLDDIALQVGVEAVAAREHANTLWNQSCHHVDWEDASYTNKQSVPHVPIHQKSQHTEHKGIWRKEENAWQCLRLDRLCLNSSPPERTPALSTPRNAVGSRTPMKLESS
jgi:hypothetical protein